MSLYRRETTQIYLYAVLNGLVNLSLPLGIQAVFNLLLGGTLSTSLLVLVGFVLFGIVVTGLLQILQLRIVENVQQNIFTRSAFEFSYRIPRIDTSQFDSIHAPELVNRFFDTLTIQKGIPKILIDFSLASFQVVFGLILLSIYSAYFIILGGVLILLLYIIFAITGPRGLQTSLKESKHKYRLAHWLEEVARTSRSFKLSADTTLHIDKTDAIATDYLKAREKHFRVLLAQFQYFIGFKVFVAAGLLVLGSILVFNEQMNLGQFVASEIIIILIINSVEKLITSIDTIYDVLTALEKIGYVTDLELDDDSTAAITPERGGMRVEALDLTFGYPDMQRKLIKELSFEVAAGGRVVVQGPSGSGKSTLLYLMSGLRHLEDGELLYNDIPIQNIRKTDLHQQIGVFLPVNQLFEGTFYENITLGRDISDTEVFEVLSKLFLTQYIAKEPKGIHTIIDPEGKRLPRSVIQRLLLARAIVHKPCLLLLEDPLASIEAEYKRRIIDYLTQPEHCWTIIVIADYSYWVERSDQVIHLS